MLRRPVARPVGRGLVGTMARTAVVAGTATAVSGNVARRQASRVQQSAEARAYRQQQQDAAMQVAAQQAAAEQVAAQQAYAPPPAPAAAPVDVVGQLTQLAALRDQGSLTDAEFEGQKARILAG